MIILNLILLTIITVFIIDLSGIIDTIKKAIWKKYIKIGDWHNLRIKPLDCSLCMSFWSGLIYLALTGHLTIPLVALTCLLAYSTPLVGDILQTIKDLLTYIINLPTKNL